MRKPYIIAEIGVNYYDIAKKRNVSLMKAAKMMIFSAHYAGADAVKFQSYKADKIASKKSPSYWDLSKEPTDNQYDLFCKYDKFNEEEYKELAEYAESRGIDFMSTPFDLEAVDYLDEIVKIHKISSSDITNYPLLKKVARTNKKILLSTGASTLDEVRNAIEVIEKEGNQDIVPLHCVLNYPTLNGDANLGMIEDLKTLGYTVGYSDHTIPDERMLILTRAWLLGAHYIEKHFTLDKTLPGNDHYHAMDFDDLKVFKKNIELITTIEGSHHKRYLYSEEISRLNARRSVYLKEDLIEGETLSEENLICKRPAIGIPANKFYEAVGRTLLKSIKKDEPLLWKHLK